MTSMQRDLGLWESYCAIAHDLAYGTGNTCMVLHLEGNLNFDILRKACYKLFLRQPLLRATLGIYQKAYRFTINAHFDDIPIHQVEGESDWLTHFCQELALVYPTNKYLWRVRVLSNKHKHHLLISGHHSIIDGMSQIAITKKLLGYYHQLLQGDDFVINSLNLPPPIEKQLPTDITWDEYTNRLKKIDDAFEPITQLRFQQNALTQDTIPQVLICDFSNTILKNLIAFCKKNNLRFNPVINAALLFAVNEIDDANNFTLHNAVNLRHFAFNVLSDEDIGCFISVVKTLHNNIAKHTNLINLARNCQQQFDENFKLTGFPPRNFPMDVIKDYFKLPETTGRKNFSAGFGISNWGSINMPQHYGALILQGLHRASGRQLGDFPFFFHIATINQAIYGAFSYVNPLISTQWMKDFAKHFQQILMGLCET